MAWTLQEVADDAQWTAPDGEPSAGCRVIVEPDPPPGAGSGHMAFGGFNATGADKCQVDFQANLVVCMPLHAAVLIVRRIMQADTPQPQQQQQYKEASRGGKRQRASGSSHGRGDDPIVSDAQLVQHMAHGSSMVQSMRMQKKAKRK